MGVNRRITGFPGRAGERERGNRLHRIVGRFGVSPCNFPTVRARGKQTRRRAGERASEQTREPTRGALRRIELKERRPLKKLVLSFPLMGPRPHLACRSDVLYERKERERDLRSDLEFRRDATRRRRHLR